MDDLHTHSDQSSPPRDRLSWLRHAFSVEQPDTFAPTDEQKQLVDDVCRWMAHRRLTTAALLGVEMHRPGNFILANVMHFFRPTVSMTLPLLHLLPLVRRALPDMKRYRAFAEMIEHRGAADYITRRLEEIEAESGTSELSRSAPAADADEAINAAREQG